MDNKNISRPFINDLKIEDAHFVKKMGACHVSTSPWR
jgi:hypothetical protein